MGNGLKLTQNSHFIFSSKNHYIIKPKAINLNLFSITKIHSCPNLKLQPASSLSSFLHNSSINEHKNMKLRENICFEIIN